MHTIRLRGPWDLVVLACSEGDEWPAACRCQMPADWSETLGPDFRGIVRYTRKFNRPTNLESHDRVWLVVEPPRSRGAVHLNDERLGRVEFGGIAGRFDITPRLRDYNSIVIEVEHTEGTDDADQPGGLVGEVRLEIKQKVSKGG